MRVTPHTFEEKALRRVPQGFSFYALNHALQAFTKAEKMANE